MLRTESSPTMPEVYTSDSPESDRIAEFARDSIDVEAKAPATSTSSFWTNINSTPTALWLDSGDINAIQTLWCDSFSGLTTNNTLLNKEVQNGIYDDLVPAARELVNDLPSDAQVRELAFILNVRHALKLVEQFRCDVSVDFHTDFAYDTEATLRYARRCHALCPEYFVVKVPLTPAGIIAIAKLRDEGIRVNCTLGFSARQNYVATALARPSFVNIFLGRLNSYVADNKLGSGDLVGEKTTLASQAEVSMFSRGLPRTDTQQIAASIRDAAQLPYLAGVDVITMPTKVALQAAGGSDAPWKSQLTSDLQVSLNDQAMSGSVQIEKLWRVGEQEQDFVQGAILSQPENAEQLVAMAREHGLADLFPIMADEELQSISEDGKIPVHHRWESRMQRGDLSIDSLMTLAGLASFAKSQNALDQRIREQFH